MLCSIGRNQFTQTDPAPLDAGSVFEASYVYGYNNPLVYSDPSGLRGMQAGLGGLFSGAGRLIVHGVGAFAPVFSNPIANAAKYGATAVAGAAAVCVLVAGAAAIPSVGASAIPGAVCANVGVAAGASALIIAGGQVVTAAAANSVANQGAPGTKPPVAVPAPLPKPRVPGVRVPAPVNLPGFPDAFPVRGKTPVQGGGGIRKRWKGADGKIYESDSQEGAVEKYNKQGKHLGQFDPETGE